MVRFLAAPNVLVPPFRRATTLQLFFTVITRIPSCRWSTQTTLNVTMILHFTYQLCVLSQITWNQTHPLINNWCKRKYCNSVYIPRTNMFLFRFHERFEQNKRINHLKFPKGKATAFTNKTWTYDTPLLVPMNISQIRKRYCRLKQWLEPWCQRDVI